jgi:hypothetical protein
LLLQARYGTELWKPKVNMMNISLRPLRTMRQATRILAALILLPLLLRTTPADAATFKNLSQRVPAHANTIIMVDVEKILASPIAQKEGWGENHKLQHAAGLTIVPPACDRFLLAANVDLEHLQPQWESAVAEVHYEPSVPKIAVRHGGSVDKIEGHDAALLPHDSYVVKFGPKLIGALSPANRQSASRWLRAIYSQGEKSQSEYLTEAMGYADKVGTPVIMAIDFENALPTHLVRERLKSLQAVSGTDANLDELAEVLGSMRGVMLGIVIKERAYGKLKVDFAKEVPLKPEVAKAIVLETLAYRGAMIDDFQDWTPKVHGKHFSIEGPFSASGMRRIFSLLETPPALQELQDQGEEVTGQQLVVASSQEYFKSTETLLDDLKEKKPGGGFHTSGQIGVWYEKYAKKIDRLPMSNVDPALLDYSGYVTSALRQAHGSMTSIGANTRVGEASANVRAPTGYVSGVRAGGRWGGYGGYGGVRIRTHQYSQSQQRQVQQRERTAIATQARIQGFSAAGNIMTQVADATSDIRRQMTEKYNVDF